MRYHCFFLVLLIYVLLPSVELHTPIQFVKSRKLHQESNLNSRTSETRKQKHVIGTMQWLWEGFGTYATGSGHLIPVTKNVNDWFYLVLILLDTMDTLWLMGLMSEYNQAHEWLVDALDFNQNIDVNLYECTVHLLGGLLSMHILTDDIFFKNKAIDLGDRLIVAFNSSSAIPMSDVNIGARTAHNHKWTIYRSFSEITTIQIEFKTLSDITGNSKYANAVDRIMSVVKNNRPHNGLLPMWINPKTGKFKGKIISLGNGVDSYYEYLLKSWLLTNKQDDNLKNEYLHAMDSVMSELVDVSAKGLIFIAEKQPKRLLPKMEQLECFLPGTLALGVYHEIGSDYVNNKHLQLAKNLTHTCNMMYLRFGTGLAPDVVMFHTVGGNMDDMYIKRENKRDILRPETIESLFVLHRTTEDEKYVKWGWKIYYAYQQFVKIDTDGDSSLAWSRGSMESFFLGETLKYLFLLFGNKEHQKQVLSLDKFVFNTKAHPLRIFSESTS